MKLLKVYLRRVPAKYRKLVYRAAITAGAVAAALAQAGVLTADGKEQITLVVGAVIAALAEANITEVES